MGTASILALANLMIKSSAIKSVQVPCKQRKTNCPSTHLESNYLPHHNYVGHLGLHVNYRHHKDQKRRIQYHTQKSQLDARTNKL